jgi:nucleoid-associated protein YgaU
MKRQNLIASVAVLVALLCLGAVSAYFLLRPGASPGPDMARVPEASDSAAPDAASRASEPTPPVEAKPEPAAPKPEEDSAEETAKAPAEPKPEEKTADSPASQPSAPDSADQPSFDVVRIEPTGEGVIAGRAVPGWKVIVESRGVKLAEAAADGQGEWTIVLDRPLAAGAHTLSLKATSPDGRQEFSSKQTVSADVAAPRPIGTAAGPVVTSGAPPGDVAQASTVQPTAVQPRADAVAMAPKPGVLAPGTAPPPAATGVSAPQAAKPQVAGPERAVTPSGAAPLSQTASVEEERAASPSSLSPQDKPGTYTILPGDTLWDIAQRYLGAGWRYPAIFRDNRKIIRNPNLIYPEQTMTIPQPSSEPN